RWNGAGWSTVENTTAATGPYDHDTINALLATSDGLYAGGAFQHMGGVPVSNIARWDGSAWSPVGEGVDGIVYSLTSIDGQIYAGGTFSHAGSTEAHYLARW